MPTSALDRRAEREAGAVRARQRLREATAEYNRALASFRVAAGAAAEDESQAERLEAAEAALDTAERDLRRSRAVADHLDAGARLPEAR